ncbi:endoplasmic reticulum resident protein 44-like isoform X2 [Convolutriloba macropyga]|uniref:endoplasmic reticulum resident protein 44-like isoform X2 n=1 Tax=Convolutriloba macropyga TaxID=536237 RepID=UPI003F520AA2
MNDFGNLIVLLLSLFIGSVQCGPALELGASDFDTHIKNYDLVLVDFHARWCKFSRMLDPVFDEASQALDELYKDKESSVKLAKVDCEKESEIAKRYGINKYPTIKLFKAGKIEKREYRGSRTKDAFVEYIGKMLESPVKEVKDIDDLADLLDKKKTNMIGYFDSKDSPDFKQFDRVAGMLRHDCGWFAAFGEVAQSQKPAGSFQIVAKPPNVEHAEKIFTSSLKTHDMFYAWAQDKCVSLVRVITFENAEELTEEGIPFLILFHKPDDTESPRLFTEVVQKQLYPLKEIVTFLTADGVQFAHPLHHMGKQIKDLPVLAIDSFKHMYVYPHQDKMFDAELLKTFIRDLQSGKLHREFHHGPDQAIPVKQLEQHKQPVVTTTKTGQIHIKTVVVDKQPVDPKREPNSGSLELKQPSTPPESQFVKLAPSDLRYSFRDEL